MQVIAHGGAGSTPDDPEARRATLVAAVRAGSTAADPIAAVVETISTLECAERFNAGIGSAVQSDGRIRTDAGVMRGSDRSVGAACGMEGVANAVAVADRVRRSTPHVLVCGPAAVRFADSEGIETGVDLWTPETRVRWDDEGLANATEAEQLAAVRDRFGSGADTVGAVATDGECVAAATSTGGRWLALAGRVGDVPQVGSGFYATGAGGASTTGAGEDIARITMAREAVRAMGTGQSAQSAAEVALETFERHSHGTAGIITSTVAGGTGIAYSSDAMQTAVASHGQLRTA